MECKNWTGNSCTNYWWAGLLCLVNWRHDVVIIFLQVMGCCYQLHPSCFPLPLDHFPVLWSLLILVCLYLMLRCRALFRSSTGKSSIMMQMNWTVDVREVNTIICALPFTPPSCCLFPCRTAVQQSIRAASAFNCVINKTSYFERKHYFYQDLPLGYQVYIYYFTPWQK